MLRGKFIVDSIERIGFKYMSSTQMRKICEGLKLKYTNSTQFHKGLRLE